MPSTVVAHMSYDETKHLLRVVYVSGMVYEYKKVPPAIYRAMKASDSKGTYLNKYIKGNYEFEKIS